MYKIERRKAPIFFMGRVGMLGAFRVGFEAGARRREAGSRVLPAGKNL